MMNNYVKIVLLPLKMGIRLCYVIGMLWHNNVKMGLIFQHWN